VTIIWDVVPGKRCASAKDALALLLGEATILRVAVAYVTGEGIAELAESFDAAGRPETVQVVTRATHTTASREDLRALEDCLAAEVHAFVGTPARHFHPKVFVARTPSATWVLSGSGNLTEGGLLRNQEQFELLKLPSGPAQTGQASAAFERTAVADVTSRWNRWWTDALPLSAALAEGAFAAWEQQTQRRAELQQQLRAMERQIEEHVGGGEGGTEAELEHSRTATEQKVRARMDRWFPSATACAQVYELLGDAIDTANDLNADGWYAGYVTDSRWGGDRLSINARHAQAFVAHSDGEVYFTAPPEAIDPAAFALCQSLGDLPGVRIVPSKIGEVDDGREHPYALVPARALDAALDAGARDLIEAIMRWRMVAGRSPKWQVHCPALVRVVARATGRRLAQPTYEP